MKKYIWVLLRNLNTLTEQCRKENKLYASFSRRCTAHFWGKVYVKITVLQMKTREQNFVISYWRFQTHTRKGDINTTSMYFSYISYVTWNLSFLPFFIPSFPPSIPPLLHLGSLPSLFSFSPFFLFSFLPFLPSSFFTKCPLCAGHCGDVTEAR